MPRFERICPECGASNSFAQANCVKCRAPLTGQVQAQNPVSSPFTRRGMAKLAWRATKFLTRKGFDLARNGAQRGIEHFQNRNKADVRNETIDAEYKLREWRTWSAKPEPAPQEKNDGIHC